MPIYKIKDGQYRVEVNYKDTNGNYKKLVRMNASTSSLSSAKKVERELQYKIENDIKIDAKEEKKQSLTINQVYDIYISQHEQETKASTHRHAEQSLRLFVIPFFKNKKVCAIDNALCLKWKSWMNEQVQQKDHSKSLSVAYKNTVYKAVKAFFNFVVDYCELSKNPFSKIGVFRDANAIDDELHYWTIEQFSLFDNALYNYCFEREKANDSDFLLAWSFYVFFNILFFCGLRKGECEALTWGDYKNGTMLSVSKAIDQKSKVGEFITTSPKNKSSIRKVPVCEKLKIILDNHYKRYSKVYLFNDDWYICGGLEPLKDTSIENIKNKFAKECNLPQIRIHDFRHSFASMLINGNVNIKTIAKWMGHSKVQETWNRYGHLYQSTEDEALSYLNAKSDEKEQK